jgi:hypothetical protein
MKVMEVQKASSSAPFLRLHDDALSSLTFLAFITSITFITPIP